MHFHLMKFYGLKLSRILVLLPKIVHVTLRPHKCGMVFTTLTFHLTSETIFRLGMFTNRSPKIHVLKELHPCCRTPLITAILDSDTGTVRISFLLF